MTPDQKDMLLVRVALATKDAAPMTVTAGPSCMRLHNFPPSEIEAAMDRLCALGFARGVATTGSAGRLFRWTGP